ncbi:MAG: hypothetical protein ACJAUW_000010 [Yoonia sp.]|jgi:hypothetical protein
MTDPRQPFSGPTAVIPAKAFPAQASEPDIKTEVGSTWWSRYRLALSKRLSAPAIEVLEADAQYIVDRAVPPAESGFDFGAWPETNVRTGMVVGSVQSGKTASMLGVAAMALDRGVDLIVLLAGTRVGLWLQTYERLIEQLDGSTQYTAHRRRNERLILPQPADILNEQRAEPTRYLQKPLAKMALKAGKPLICVVPKEDDHLLFLRRFLNDVVDEKFLTTRDKPFTMLLLDDEADDASVLDSDSSMKVTPRLITALWSGDSDLSNSRHPRLFASYIAYTATPQANYLQATHNPLTPRDFNAALRVPGNSGASMPRSLTFTEPSGISGYYCGGEVYYELVSGLGDADLCLPFPFPELRQGESQSELDRRHETIRWKMLSDALRSYMIGAAIRLHQSGKSLSRVRSSIYDSADEAIFASPKPHTMLHHPSALKGDHFSAAADIVRWSMVLPGEENEFDASSEENGEFAFSVSVDGLRRRLDAEEDTWKAWLGKFEGTRVALSSSPHAPYQPISLKFWSEIRQILLEEIFPNLTIRVLNSDPASDDRPRFDPEFREGSYLASPDLLSIFVAGNVLSRGLTLEGLAVSLFLRGSNEPAADTQMQMQRWFGYRGTFLPFCRVLTFDDQLELFRRYNINDAALKSEIINKMADPFDASESSILVLQGTAFVATSKVESRKVPLSPGPRPSIRIVEGKDPKLASENVAVLNRVCNSGKWVTLADANGFKRGIIREEPIDLMSLADILDEFRYSHHDPDKNSELSKRWRHYEALLGLDAPLFRPPGNSSLPYAAEPQSCPYSIAAYLRLWSALRGDRQAPGFFPTDRPNIPWNFADGGNMINPQFYLAIRFGEHEARDERLRSHGIRTMTRQLSTGGKSLQTLWGTRGYGGKYIGDELVDYYHHNTQPVPTLQGGASWRPRGHPGLAMFHVIRCESAPNDLIAVGLGLPHGGPDHIAALKT